MFWVAPARPTSKGIFVSIFSVHAIISTIFILDQLATHSIRFSTGTYSFKLETDYNFCNEVKEGVSAIRRFDWSRENIRHTGIIIIIIIIISLFQEDSIFGTNASLTYGP